MNRNASELTSVADDIFHMNGGTMSQEDYYALYGLASDIDTVEDERLRLLELVGEMYEDQVPDEERWRYRDRLRELGVV
jgi:hypothetical protein